MHDAMHGYGNSKENEVTVQELIDMLQELPPEAKVLTYGGDEYYHIATQVILKEHCSDVEEEGVKGPFVDIT